jgi:hypothetical protein
MIGLGLGDCVGIEAGASMAGYSFLLGIKRETLPGNDLAVLRDWHIDAGAAFATGRPTACHRRIADHADQFALILLHRSFARRRRWSFDDLNLCVVNMRGHLSDIARIEPLSAGRAFFLK